MAQGRTRFTVVQSVFFVMQNVLLTYQSQGMMISELDFEWRFQKAHMPSLQYHLTFLGPWAEGRRGPFLGNFLSAQDLSGGRT